MPCKCNRIRDVYFEFHSFVDFVMIFAQNEMHLFAFPLEQSTICSGLTERIVQCILLLFIECNVMHLHFGSKIIIVWAVYVCVCSDIAILALDLNIFTGQIWFRIIEFWRCERVCLRFVFDESLCSAGYTCSLNIVAFSHWLSHANACMHPQRETATDRNRDRHRHTHLPSFFAMEFQLK